MLWLLRERDNFIIKFGHHTIAAQGMIGVVHLDHGFFCIGAVVPLGMLVVLPYDLGTQNGLQAIFNGNIPGCGDFVNCFLLFLLAIREAITADTALPTTVDTAAVRAAVTNALYIGLTLQGVNLRTVRSPPSADRRIFIFGQRTVRVLQTEVIRLRQLGLQKRNAAFCLHIHFATPNISTCVPAPIVRPLVGKPNDLIAP